MALRLGERERLDYFRDGFLLRHSVFDAEQVERWRDAVERVVALVIGRARRPDAGPEMRLGDGHRLQFSSRTVIQWEWREGSPDIRLLEPFTHLDPRFNALWEDPRLVEPVRDMLGVEARTGFGIAKL